MLSDLCLCFLPLPAKKEGKKAVWELCSAAWAGKPQPRVLRPPVLLGTARGEQQLLLGHHSPLVGKKNKTKQQKPDGWEVKGESFS